MSAALEVSALSSGYGEALVLRDVALAVQPGEIFAMLGKNGMGKSTLLKTVMGFIPVRAGRVRLFGADRTGQAPHRIARSAVAYTPQEQALFQDLSVRDNLQLGLRDRSHFEEDLARIGRAFPFLPTRLAQRAGTLSGGEQKMLLVARALMARPKLMLIDEITEGMQPSVIERLAEVLRGERDRAGTAMLLIEQNVQFALSVGDRYAVLKRGEIVDRGAVSEAGAAERITEHLSV